MTCNKNYHLLDTLEESKPCNISNHASENGKSGFLTLMFGMLKEEGAHKKRKVGTTGGGSKR